MKSVFKLALCQMKVIDNKAQNIAKAEKMLGEAAGNGADIIVLPEMFNCPYTNLKFIEYGECVQDGETLKALSNAAKKLDKYIIAGSIPEIEGDKVYNSSFVFDRNGKIIGRHRKIHLFDVDVEGRLKFAESDTLTPGDGITVVDTEFCTIGVAICYDMRFPELMRLMALKGARLIVVPAAFNMVTGPAHWEPLIRIRAIDNQVYMAAASPSRDENFSYVAYGNSMIADPWGNITARAGAYEEIIYSEIDNGRTDKVREELPLIKHRRLDLYDVLEKQIL